MALMPAYEAKEIIEILLFLSVWPSLCEPAETCQVYVLLILFPLLPLILASWSNFSSLKTKHFESLS